MKNPISRVHLATVPARISMFVAAVLMLLHLFSQHSAAAPAPRLVPAGALDCPTAAGDSFAPTLTPDGRFVLFLSNARNLVTNQFSSPHLYAYVRDLSNGTTVLGSLGPSNRLDIITSVSTLSLSSNGQFVAFITRYGTNRSPYAYVRDLGSGNTASKSIFTNGNPVGVLKAMLSADARWLYYQVPFYSAEGGIPGGPGSQIYAHDLLSNRTDWVSVGSYAPGWCWNCGPDLSSITPDGRYSAYISTAPNQLLNVINTGEVYVRDLQNPLPTWASTNVGHFLPSGYMCHNAALSADGQCVAFWGRVYNSASILFHHRLGTGTTTPILTNLGSYYSPVEISSDGRFVAQDDGTNVFLYDAQLQTNLLVSINREGAGPGNDVSHTPAITPDGRSIVFLSSATDLVTNATNGKFQVYVRDMVAGTTRLVTVNTNGAASDADLESTQPVISNDGRLVAFESTANDLIADDLNRASDVFVRDLSTSTTQLVSERESSRPSSTDASFSTKSSSPGCISSNGQWVAFASSDGNLVANDTNGVNDVFVAGPTPEEVRCAGWDTTSAGDAVSSHDGRFVAFTRQNTNVSWAPFVGDVYRYDVSSNVLALVSAQTNGLPGGLSASPAISPDGRFVAFVSKGSGLVPAGTPPAPQIVIRDMDAGTNLVASKLPGLDFWNYTSSKPLFSPDGRWLAFQMNVGGSGIQKLIGLYDMAGSTNLIVSPLAQDSVSEIPFSFSSDAGALVLITEQRILWFCDLRNGTNFENIVSLPQFEYAISNPGIDRNGRFICYEQWFFWNQRSRQIYLLDRQTGLTNLISINKTGTADGNDASSNPLITPDGQFVIFASQASDLVEGDTNGVSDIFVRDRLRNVTMLVSVNKQGQAGNGPSTSPVLAGDGRTVLFQSFAGDLVAGDYNMKRDLFVLHLGAGDTEGDGLDDDWEMAYFSTLSRDGSADYDHDGLTDKQEFLAGTDPTDTGSVLRVLALNPMGAATTTLMWPAAVGRIYRLQYKTNLTDSTWLDFPVSPNINAGTASVTVTNLPDTHRFYRAVIQVGRDSVEP